MNVSLNFNINTFIITTKLYNSIFSFTSRYSQVNLSSHQYISLPTFVVCILCVYKKTDIFIKCSKYFIISLIKKKILKINN